MVYSEYAAYLILRGGFAFSLLYVYLERFGVVNAPADKPESLVDQPLRAEDSSVRQVRCERQHVLRGKRVVGDKPRYLLDFLSGEGGTVHQGGNLLDKRGKLSVPNIPGNLPGGPFADALGGLLPELVENSVL